MRHIVTVAVTEMSYASNYQIELLGGIVVVAPEGWSLSVNAEWIASF